MILIFGLGFIVYLYKLFIARKETGISLRMEMINNYLIIVGGLKNIAYRTTSLTNTNSFVN